MPIEQFTETLTSRTENNDIPYAKGIGNPSAPINSIGSFAAKAGEPYTSHTGYDTLILSKQCGVSINNTPIVVFPERSSFYVKSDTAVMFDRDVLVVLAKSKTTSYPESGSNANGNWIKFEDGTLICHRYNVSVLGNGASRTNEFGSTAGVTNRYDATNYFPVTFVGYYPSLSVTTSDSSASKVMGTASLTHIYLRAWLNTAIYTTGGRVSWIAIGRWKL